MAVQIFKRIHTDAVSPDRLDICQRCKNAYILIWLNEGEDYNDFGFRYCPFCGLLIDEFTGSVVE